MNFFNNPTTQVPPKSSSTLILPQAPQIQQQTWNSQQLLRLLNEAIKEKCDMEGQLKELWAKMEAAENGENETKQEIAKMKKAMEEIENRASNAEANFNNIQKELAKANEEIAKKDVLMGMFQKENKEKQAKLDKFEAEMLEANEMKDELILCIKKGMGHSKATFNELKQAMKKMTSDTESSSSEAKKKKMAD